MLLLLLLLSLLLLLLLTNVHVVVVIVVVDPVNLPLKFGLNRVRNSWDFYDIEFVVVVGGLKEFSCQTQLLSWVVVVTILRMYISLGRNYLTSVICRYIIWNFLYWNRPTDHPTYLSLDALLPKHEKGSEASLHSRISWSISLTDLHLAIVQDKTEH